MRRGSFYIGAIVLGTGGGYALAVWALQVASVHTSVGAAESALSGALGGWLALAGFVGALGLIVAGVESRAMAAARRARRPWPRNCRPRRRPFRP